MPHPRIGWDGLSPDWRRRYERRGVTRETYEDPSRPLPRAPRRRLGPVGPARDRRRFLERVQIPADPDACLMWVGARNRDGYGKFSVSRKDIGAHRFAYMLWVGPIPGGLQLDHLCRNRSCVRPDHLEPVTGRENLLRGIGHSAVNARKTHCVNGHLFDELNTGYRLYRQGGGRFCRSCARAASQRSRRRRAA